MLQPLLPLLFLLSLVAGRPARMEALDAYDHGRTLEALDLLRAGLERNLAQGAYAGREGALQAELDALVYFWLARETESWTAEEQRLGGLAEALDPLAPEAAFYLRYLRGEALRCVGRYEEARRLFAELGFTNDYLLIGPFDNERGGGYATSHGPESAVDPSQALQGKEREVRWRANPCPQHPLKRITLDDLFVPNQQVLAYAATAIRSEKAVDVELRLGCSGFVRVYLNGVELAGHDVERPHFPDQERVLLPLQPGWNQLVLKLGVEEGAWTLETRLCDGAGRSVAGLAVDSSRVGPPLAPRATSGAAEPTPRTLLEQSQGAQAARDLALYHWIVHPDDRAQESDARAAALAVERDPEDVQGRYLQALALRPETTRRTEMTMAPYLRALQDVLQRDPHHVSAMLDLAEASSELLPLPERADELSRRALDEAPQCWRAAIARSRYLYKRNRDGEGRKVLQDHCSDGEALRRGEAMLIAAEAASDRGDPAAALAAYEAAAAQRLSVVELIERLAGRLIDLDRTDEAFAWIQRGLEAAPFAVTTRLRVARNFEYAGREDLARRLVEEARTIVPESSAVLELLARLEERAGRLEESSALLAEVLDVDPGNDRVRRKRLLLMRRAGDSERFESDWRRDAATLVALPMPEGSENDPLEVLDRTSVWKLHPSGSESVYQHSVVRVLNPAGVQGLDRYAIDYPADGRLQVLTLRVLHRDGSSERAPAPRREDVERGGTAYRVYDLPPLEIGDVVDVEYRVDQTRPDVFGQYFGLRHVFYPDGLDPLAPTRRAELVVIAPPGLELYSKSRNGERVQHEQRTGSKGERIERWWIEDLARPALESAMARREEYAPLVEVSTYRDWAAFGRWWWSFISKELDDSPAMKAKVAELTRGLDDERARIAALTRFVGQEIRYNAWPFGTHGYEPFRASTILERGFGDCKDKSILLCRMLAELGIDAHPVLLRAEYARAEEPLDLPLVEHFNHCIAYVPDANGGEGLYLDATADHNPLDYLRADDQGAQVLHVSAAGVELRRIPYAAPEENRARSSFRIRLAADASAQVDYVDDSNGQAGVMMRMLYGGQKEALEDQLARVLNKSFGNVRFRSLRTSELDDIDEPALLEASFDCDALGSAQGDARLLPIAFDVLGLDGLAVEDPSQRHQPVVLDRPYRVESRVLWELSDGWKLARLPDPMQTGVVGLLSYELRVSQPTPAQVLIERSFQMDTRRIELADYASFHAALAEIRLAESRTLRIVRKDNGGGR